METVKHIIVLRKINNSLAISGKVTQSDRNYMSA